MAAKNYLERVSGDRAPRDGQGAICLGTTLKQTFAKLVR